MRYEEEIRTAIEAVIEAVKLCELVRRDTPSAIEKSDKSPVTVADFGSQALICRALERAFPNDPVVGEEDARMLAAPEAADILAKVTTYVGKWVPGATPDRVTAWINRGAGAVASRYWTLDPIDGTKGFLRGDQYAVALALIERGEVQAGVLACPAMPVDTGAKGVLYAAVRGGGAFMKLLTGGAPLRLRVAEAGDAGSNTRFVEGVESSHSDQELQRKVARLVGITAPPLQVDSQAKYGIVASGQAALYLRLPSPEDPIYRENIWDHAAGSIIVEEAGGLVTDMYGKPLEFTAPKMMNNRGVVVGNGMIHERVIEIIKEENRLLSTTS